MLSTWTLASEECRWKLLYPQFSYYPQKKSPRGVLWIKMFCEFSSYSTENTRAGVFCFIKLQPPAILTKILLHRRFHVNFFKISQNTFLWNTSTRLLLYPLIPIFHSRKMAHKINSIHRKALKLVYGDSRYPTF